MNSLLDFCGMMAGLAATYILHSTIAIAACWCVLRFCRVRSHYLAERGWKFASVLGLCTACLQFSLAPLEIVTLLEPTQIATLPTQPSELVSRGDEPKVIADDVSSSETLDVPATWLDEVPVSELDLPQGDEGWRESVVSVAPLPPPARTSDEPKPLGTSDDIRIERVNRGSAAIGLVGNLAGRIAMCVVCVAPLVVFCGGLLLLGWRSLRHAALFSDASVVTKGAARRVLDKFLKRRRIRRTVTILESPTYTEPMTFGLFRWFIVLPVGMEDELKQDELKALLAHEVAHLVRGDVWWMWGGRLLCTCLILQPLNLLARRRWQQAAEYLCDDWALERGVGAFSLARCITRIAELRISAPEHVIGLAAAGTKSTLVDRVERLVNDDRQLDQWRTPPRRKLLCVAAASIAVTAVCCAPRVAVPSPSTLSASLMQTDKLHRSVDDTLLAEWRSVQVELSELDAELRRLGSVVRQSQTPEVEECWRDLEMQAATLHSRSEHLTSLLEMEALR